LKNNGKVVLFGHKISNKNITEGDRNIPMALKILSKKMAPQKSEGQGNIASEKKERNKNNFLISRTGALLAVKKCHQNKFVFKKKIKAEFHLKSSP